MTTAEYGISKAARPFNSRLDKRKLAESGFVPAYLLCARLMQNQKRPVAALALLICAERACEKTQDLQARTECALRKKELMLMLAALQISKAETLAATTTDPREIVQGQSDTAE